MTCMSCIKRNEVVAIMKVPYFQYWKKHIFSHNVGKHTSNIERQTVLVKLKESTSNIGRKRVLTVIEAVYYYDRSEKFCL